MIIKGSMVTGRRMQPPARRSGVIRIASIDAEWLKNYKVKNGQRPFCYSVVWLDLPASGGADLADVPFEWTSVYIEEPGEMGTLIQHAADTLTAAADTAHIITGHQFSSDLAVLEAHAPEDAVKAVRDARSQWKKRRDANRESSYYLDTRYDAGHLLTGTSRRLVDVCTELGLDVTQPELLKVTMPAWHRRWLDDGRTEAANASAS